MDNIDNIKNLIDRYLNGETTNEEERIISNYFATNDVPDDLIPYKEMFADLSKPDEGPDNEGIDTFFQGNGIEKRLHHHTRIIHLYARATVVACSVILVFLAGLHWHTLSDGNPTYTYNRTLQKERIRIVTVDKLVHDTINTTKVVMKTIKAQQPLKTEDNETVPTLKNISTTVPTADTSDGYKTETAQNIDNDKLTICLNILPY